MSPDKVKALRRIESAISRIVDRLDETWDTGEAERLEALKEKLEEKAWDLEME